VPDATTVDRRAAARPERWDGWRTRVGAVTHADTAPVPDLVPAEAADRSPRGRAAPDEALPHRTGPCRPARDPAAPDEPGV